VKTHLHYLDHPTGQKQLKFGSECVITFTDADERILNKDLRKLKRLCPKAFKLSKQANIPLNDAMIILLRFNRRIEETD
jgi:hypothetical protein